MDRNLLDMSLGFPEWLEQLRREEIVARVRDDERSTDGTLLGVPFRRVFREVIEGGQADFDADWHHLSPDDRALLYAYVNQNGHLHELSHAFEMLFACNTISDPVVLDLGCGPFTAGLAFAAARGPKARFCYVGVDRSAAMCRLAERLAHAAERLGGIEGGATRLWARDPEQVCWPRAPSWRHVVVVASYLLASPSLDLTHMLTQFQRILTCFGRGPVAVLYTNALGDRANHHFDALATALESQGFALKANDTGSIQLTRGMKLETRYLQYALFHRQAGFVLNLGD